MMRFSTLFFCLLLAAAAIGRYKAEASVRADRSAIQEIEQQIEAERAQISELKLQVEVLESGPRLAQLAQNRLGLVPAQPAQLADARDLAMLVDAEYRDRARPRPAGDGDFIIDAIAMADFGKPGVER